MLGIGTNLDNCLPIYLIVGNTQSLIVRIMQNKNHQNLVIGISLCGICSDAFAHGDATHLFIVLFGQLILLAYGLIVKVAMQQKNMKNLALVLLSFPSAWIIYVGSYYLLERILGEKYLLDISPILFYGVLIGIPIVVLRKLTKPTVPEDSAGNDHE